MKRDLPEQIQMSTNPLESYLNWILIWIKADGDNYALCSELNSSWRCLQLPQEHLLQQCLLLHNKPTTAGQAEPNLLWHGCHQSR